MQTISTNKKNSIVLFLLWPFFSVIYALKNYKAPWAKDILWFFVVFFGFTLTIHNTGEETNDANRYKDKFVTMASHEISFSELTASFYNAEDQTLDILESLIIFCISRFTGNVQVLFAVFGLIFGYFYSRNIWFLIDRAGRKIVPENIPVIITFAFIVGFWQLSGFRFWCGAQIFLYGTLPYLFDGNKRSLRFSFLAVLMHFAYVLPLGVLGIFIFTGRKSKLFFGMFIVTFFLKEFSISQISDFLTTHLPAILQPKVKTYTNTEVIERQAEDFSKVNWYIKAYTGALKWTIVSFLIAVFLTGQKFLSRNKNFNNLLSFTLLMYSAANVAGMMPSGGRFLAIANLFAVALIFFYVQYAPRSKAIKRIIVLSVPSLALYNIVAIRVSFDIMSLFVIFGNPILSMFINVDITIIEMVKQLIS